MPQKSYAELTTEELTKRRKTTLLVTSISAGMLLVLFGLGMLLTFKKGEFSIFTVIPLAFLPILIINIGQVRLIDKELTARDKPSDML